MSRHKKTVLTLHRPKKIAHWGPKKPKQPQIKVKTKIQN